MSYRGHCSGYYSSTPVILIKPIEFIWRSGSLTWWRHQMEIFSALLAICAGKSPVPGEFPTHRPVTRSFDVYFDLRPNKRLSNQSWGWWFETRSRPLWRHRNVDGIPYLSRSRHTHPWLLPEGGRAYFRLTSGGNIKNFLVVRRAASSWNVEISNSVLINSVMWWYIWVRSRNYGCLVTWFCYQFGFAINW